ncbi:CDK-activating kinase assembly factor MAT1 [Frankliniella fusca]|uniref:CDK-activating kinase assembly factor MAT1 n=1 Tax=Frankliniella fusca TaxID=407009 RepID=A0AAE1H837_9NEOP|nr:CDK-activating kinase assembly factor MAT1 [Frankliniella fusca]
MDMDIACPRCKTTKYRNPSLKLLVNVCGHGLCESCVDLLFLKGSGNCPECGVALRRSNFRVQLFEDSQVEKEVDIRRRVLRDFNKKEEDFATLRDYNDYLEEVETIIYNLVNNIDQLETNKKIEKFKKENRELILKNKARAGREEAELEALLEQEAAIEEARRAQIAMEEKEEKRRKIRNKEALIDELMFSTGNARNIVQTFAESRAQDAASQAAQASPVPAPTVRATQFSTGIQIGRGSGHVEFLPVPRVDDTPLFHYEAPTRIFDGPAPPTLLDVDQNGYLNHIRTASEEERAGGYNSNISCLRALEEAMSGLYYRAHRGEAVF